MGRWAQRKRESYLSLLIMRSAHVRITRGRVTLSPERNHCYSAQIYAQDSSQCAGVSRRLAIVLPSALFHKTLHARRIKRFAEARLRLIPLKSFSLSLSVTCRDWPATVTISVGFTARYFFIIFYGDSRVRMKSLVFLESTCHTVSQANTIDASIESWYFHSLMRQDNFYPTLLAILCLWFIYAVHKRNKIPLKTENFLK